MSNWLEIGKLEDIPRLGSRVVALGDLEIAIFRTAKDDLRRSQQMPPQRWATGRWYRSRQ